MAAIDKTVITAIVIHLQIQAPKLAHILPRCCSFEKTVWPNENSRWRPFFKMAAIDNTVITAIVVHLSIQAPKLAHILLVLLFELLTIQLFSFCNKIP